MRSSVPAHLNPTWDLLAQAFPSGMTDADYWAVLEILYPHMSDRNLAEVLAAFLQRDIARVTNDVYAVGAGRRATAEAASVARERLTRAGFDHWAQEE